MPAPHGTTQPLRAELRTYLARQRDRGPLNHPQAIAWALLMDFDQAQGELRRALKHLPKGGEPAREIQAFLDSRT